MLRASTAIFGIFEQVRIDGKVYTDGGTLAALPLWAAAELGAERIVAVNALPGLPGMIPRLFVAIVRSLSRFRPVLPKGLDVLKIAPPGLLGTGREALWWSRKNVERWIEAGRKDAQAALSSPMLAKKHFR